MEVVVYRSALAADAATVAELHADSWRRHYRGAYPDEYLDGPVFDDRLAVWSERLADPARAASTVLASVAGELVGFVHVVHDADELHGSLIDNLHVRSGRERTGVGRELMRRAATLVVRERPGRPMFLWVLEQNERAQAFYGALGGDALDRKTSTPPGDGGRLITAIRYVWPDPAEIT